MLALTGSSVAPPTKEKSLFPQWEEPQRSQSEPALALAGSSVPPPNKKNERADANAAARGSGIDALGLGFEVWVLMSGV